MKLATLGAAAFFSCLLISVSLCSAQGESGGFIGDWDLIYKEHGGQGMPMPLPGDDGMRFSVAKESIQIVPAKNSPAARIGKPSIQGSWVVDDKQSPKHLDLTLEDVKPKRVLRCIYEIKDDVLTICTSLNERPKTFQTKDTENTLYRCKRVRDKAGAK